MYIKINRFIYDRYNPERGFNAGTILKVNDPERAQYILSSDYGMEVPEAGDYDILDRVNNDVSQPEVKPKRKPKK